MYGYAVTINSWAKGVEVLKNYLLFVCLGGRAEHPEKKLSKAERLEAEAEISFTARRN